ncbi:ArsR family transcriptional regulator [Egibacter rhizosphaerae]|uniref:ArsR family transcriptional regulator n=1 Tax=Egibacter rhizosphaerae TaxID=1670831 RepID=A0A411YB26_9ACTN|nr:metalloregulator ArsR/SmtB family transcription factor [Egibacter rhizosphaerae]QBI18443.1 ArsR family transcriptional regulator [Egibacter rhizosphaerae]
MTDASFAALGDPVRRRILELLAEGEQPVGTLVVTLAAEHPISQPAVSQHLRVLRDAGLVTVRAYGTRRLYDLDRDGLREAATWLAGLAEQPGPFTQPFDALATEVVRSRRATTIREGGARADPAAG